MLSHSKKTEQLFVFVKPRRVLRFRFKNITREKNCKNKVVIKTENYVSNI